MGYPGEDLGMEKVQLVKTKEIQIKYELQLIMSVPRGSLVQRICLPTQETWVQCQNQEDLLEQEMATNSSILAWEIPQTEEVGGLQSTGHKESDTTQ